VYSYGNRPKSHRAMVPKRAIISDNAIVDFYNLIFDNHFDQSLVIVGVPAKSITKISG
jgi:carbonic anhydrase/acetyltransferase-like protein (isoleucine patch superfamily)